MHAAAAIDWVGKAAHGAGGAPYFPYNDLLSIGVIHHPFQTGQFSSEEDGHDDQDDDDDDDTYREDGKRHWTYAGRLVRRMRWFLDPSAFLTSARRCAQGHAAFDTVTVLVSVAVTFLHAVWPVPARPTHDGTVQPSVARDRETVTVAVSSATHGTILAPALQLTAIPIEPLFAGLVTAVSMVTRDADALTSHVMTVAIVTMTTLIPTSFSPASGRTGLLTAESNVAGRTGAFPCHVVTPLTSVTCALLPTSGSPASGLADVLAVFSGVSWQACAAAVVCVTDAVHTCAHAFTMWAVAARQTWRLFLTSQSRVVSVAVALSGDVVTAEGILG